jgi:histidinol-phosphate/aromatic aminotransferase/cobyric acid decarboxylase-like protein
MIHDAVSEVDGLTMPVYPSNGNFVIIDVSESGITPEALVEAYQRRNIMIRQGGYHTERFASYFVKVSTTVPSAWMQEFCDQLKDAVEDARGINDVGAQF